MKNGNSLMHTHSAEESDPVKIRWLTLLVFMQSGLQNCRHPSRKREVHNTIFRILRHFLTIFPGKSVWPIFMKLSGFVYHVKD